MAAAAVPLLLLPLLLLLQSAAAQEEIFMQVPHTARVGSKLFRDAPWLYGVRLPAVVDGKHEYFSLVTDRGDHHLQLNGYLHDFVDKVVTLKLLHETSDKVKRLLRLHVLPPPTEPPALKYQAGALLARSRRQVSTSRREVNVLENVASGSPLFFAVSPASSSERYVLKAPPPPELRIDPTTSRIFLQFGSTFDYSNPSRRQIDFTVLVQTASGSGFLRSLDFRILVQQVPVTSPTILRFAKRIWSVLYMETRTLDGAMVYLLQARVASNASAVMRYEFIPGMLERAEGRFRVVPDLGYIVTKLNDGYPPNKVYKLGVRAVNTGSLAPLTKYGYAFVRVYTMYQPPQFSRLAYMFRLFEGTAVGSTVGTIACRSLNNVWSTVTLTSRMSPSVSSFFRMSPAGVVTTLQEFDYDVPTSPKFWYFTAVCTENATLPTRRVAEAEVVIALYDINDNRPYFNLQYYVKPTPTAEGTASGTEVFRVRAQDADTKPNALLTYTLAGTHSSFFNVTTDPATLDGVITVSSAGLDFEVLPPERKVAEFTISVTDGVSGTSVRPSATIVIPVSNVNDNQPQLNNFTVTVQRRAPVGAIVLQLQARDADGSSVKYYFWTGSSTGSQYPSATNQQLLVDENSGIVTVGGAGLTGISTATYQVPIRAVDDGTCEGCPRGTALSSEIAYLTLTIRDSNEAAPAFGTSCPSSAVNFQEEQAAGSTLTTITATDPASSGSGSSAAIRYDLIDNLIVTNPTKFFRINETTGVVTATTVIDIESTTDKINIIKNYFWLTVRARNIFNSRFTLCNFQVQFTDVNDNVPEFDLDFRAGTTRVEVVVSTRTAGGTTIGQVQAFDPDLYNTPASTVEYFLISSSPSTSLFDLRYSDNICSIRTTAALGSVANMSMFTLTIEARNPTSTPVIPSTRSWNRIQFVVYVTSLASLLPPTIVTNPATYTITVNENIPRLQTLFTLSTTDSSAKLQMEEKLGRYTQTNLASDSYFGLQTDTATVCTGNTCRMVLLKAFAFEDFNSFSVGIRATSYTKAVGTSIDRIYTDVYKRIVLTDVNNLKPRYINQNYISIDFLVENAPRGTRVTQAFAVDRDSTDAFRRVTYSINRSPASPDDNALFTVDPTTGVITTNAPPTAFDAESSKNIFYFEVVASDSEKSSNPGISGPNTHNLPLTVRLSDVNDNRPTFAQTMYYLTVREDAALGFVVGTVTGSDRDATAQLRYLIQSGDSNYDFMTNVETGQIMVAKPLSFFRNPSYLLTYLVTDGPNSATTQVNITVIDVNNNAPEFRPTAYYNITNVTEGQPAQAIWKLDGIDKDSVSPTFSLAGTWVSPPYSLFRIDRNTGVLSTTGPLDRELSPVFRFNALLSDNGSPINRVAYAVVDVWPRDINDNRPVWDVPSLHGQLKDGSPPGTNFMRLRAIDPDITGTLRFALVPNATAATPYVTVGVDGGVSSTPILGVADRESLPPLAPRGLFTFVVTVTDGVGSPVTGTATVTIEDINDNAPTFNRSLYTVSIPETTAVGENVFTAAAEDVDLVDEGKLRYSIIDPNDYFTIANVISIDGGAVILTKKLDYENASMPKTFSLRIRVEDSTPPPYSATCTLSITILEINDNAPVINFNPGASVTKLEGPTSIGALGVSFTATDADSVDTAFTFSVLPASDPYGNLELTAVTATGGAISVKAALDREIWGPAPDADAVHEYVILATDPRGLTGSATLTVTIQDIKDTPPNLKERYVVRIMEGDAVGTIAQPASLVVEDKDKSSAGGPFTITPDLSAGTNWTGRFSLTGATATTFSIANAKVFDREVDGKDFLLQVLMRDPDGVTGTGTVTVIIGDKNDSPITSNGYKQVYVYLYDDNYNYWFNTSYRLFLGYSVVFDRDDVDRTGEKFTLETVATYTRYFELEPDGGMYLKGATPASNYSLTIRVEDPSGSVAYSKFIVTVTSLPYEALLHSGSLVIKNVNPAQFVRRQRVPGTETLGRNRFPEYYFSMYDQLKLELSRAIGTTFLKTHIFFVDELHDKSGLIVRYTALGSPYYYESKLAALVTLRKDTINATLRNESAGAYLEMVPLDLCRLESDGPEKCTSGCRNTMIINRRTPTSVIRNSTALIGVNVTIVTSCDCSAASYAIPRKCNEEACFHDGNCTDTPGSNTFTCACPPGHEGPRCERMKVGFPIEGWVSLSPIEGGCSELHLSFYFITTQVAASVLLLYTGPFAELASAAASLHMKDFLALELINGKPKLSIELGGGVSVVGLHATAAAAALNDGKWHRIDIFLRGKVVILKVDMCESAPTVLDGNPSGPALSSCMAMLTISGSYSKLNAASFPLFLGGRYNMASGTMYPAGLATTGFLGQVARLRLNSLYYDLYVGPRTWYLNAVNDFNRTLPSCSMADGSKKCVNGWCWGVLEGATASGSCSCYAGYRPGADGRCREALQPSELKTGSYLRWKAKGPFMATLNKQLTTLDVQFKTRQPTGTLLRVSGSDPYRPEHMQLDLVNSRLVYQHNLGNYVLTRVMLPNSNVSDGTWHWIRATRSLRDVELMLDGGEGYNYYYWLGNQTSNYNYLVMGDLITAGAQLTTETGSITIQPPNSDLKDTCISTVRVNGRWLPVRAALGADASAVATVLSSTNVVDGCANGTPIACPAGAVCPATFVCLPAWRPMYTPYCGCAPGYILFGGRCYNYHSCIASNPCAPNGVCSVVGGEIVCVCNSGWGGPFCNIPGASIGSAGLIVILLIVGIFLLFIVAMIIWFCCCAGGKGEPLLIDAPYENVIEYNEEGGGQEDKTSFDMAQLRIRISDDTVVKQTVTTVKSSRTDFSSMMQGRLATANAGPDPSPFDGVLDYEYEGRGAVADDLDSIVSGDEDKAQNFDFLKGWGPSFQRVAEVYTSFPDHADDLQSSGDLDSVFDAGRTGQGQYVVQETITTTTRQI